MPEPLDHIVAPRINFAREINEIELRLDNRPVDFPWAKNKRTVPQIISTIGLEVESSGLSRAKVSNILIGIAGGFGSNFSVTRDASTEVNCYDVPISDRKSIAISAHTKEGMLLFGNSYPKHQYGYEAVSIPMEFDTTELTLGLLMPKLEASGDFISERCATHVHIGQAHNLSILKNALSLGLYAEPLFYALSTFGESRFRGLSNNAIYARPLSSGQCVKAENGEYYQIFNYKKALRARTIDEFWYSMGIDPDRDSGKYVAGRYFALNILSIILHGTLEFRYFNQSLDYSKVLAVTKLSQLFAEITLRARTLSGLDISNVFSEWGESELVRMLEKIVYLGEVTGCSTTLTKSEMNILLQILHTKKECKLEEGNVLTHLRDYAISMETVKRGELEQLEKRPKHPGHIDIHNIGMLSILGGE